ncbi:MAG: exodeoxyribonuclease VII large subunit, partial [Comamonadaceae bacterium]
AMPVIIHRQRQRFSIGQAALARNRPDVKRRGEQLRSGMRNLASAARHLLARRQQRWEVLAARLAAQDPAQPLKRGFALVTDASGAIVRDAAQLRPQQRLEVRFGQGEASVDVIEARGALPVR